MAKAKTLLRALGFRNWEKLAELTNAPDSCRVTCVNCRLCYVNPDLYSLEEWNAVLKAVGCQEARTPTDAKNALRERMLSKQTC